MTNSGSHRLHAAAGRRVPAGPVPVGRVLAGLALVGRVLAGLALVGRVLAGLVLVGLVLVQAGCSGAVHGATATGTATTGAADTGTADTGTVHGTIAQIGGPPGAEPGHPAGAVTVTRAGRQVAEQKVAEGGEFRFTLSPGAYRLAVKGVDGGCAPTDVTVPAGHADQQIELTCQRK